jgi:hypothetical protein
MVRQHVKQLSPVAWAALILLLLLFVSQIRIGQASPQTAALRPTVSTQIFDVNCTSLASITPTYAKLADLATFTVQSPDSAVELTFNGRIYVGSFASGTGAVFELRVDNTPSSVGRARSNLRAAEAGGGGIQTSITGVFNGLEAGEHTASIWVRTSPGGAANQAVIDPGCWSTDVLIVNEYTPFGLTHMPILRAP